MAVELVDLMKNVKGYYIGAKAAVEALASVPEGSLGYATDTNEFGSYDGSAWTWGQGGSGVTDHGDLDGLADDDHPQYLTHAEGDAAYAPLANGVTNGDSHDHSGGDGGTIDHTTLSNIGSWSHATLESILSTGWIPTVKVWTYASADAPVFQIYVSGDVSTGSHPDYKVGNKIKCNQAGTDVYGFIVKLGAYDSGNNRTPVDIYCGTDYSFTATTISDPYISKIKSPDGFPLDPEKWTVVLNDTSNRSQASPSASTWYNLGSLSINIPIGKWRVYYELALEVVTTLGAATNWGSRCTLSTANNSESDSDFTGVVTSALPAMTGATDRKPIHREKPLTINTKTTYYLLGFSGAGGTSVSFRGDVVATNIRCVCLYL